MGGPLTKLREWVCRYLRCEIVATVGELGGAAVAYMATGSYTAVTASRFNGIPATPIVMS